MPKVISVGSASTFAWLSRLIEPWSARLGWLTGRVPSGVTPTVNLSRWWR